MRLNIITPMSRPENLQILTKSVVENTSNINNLELVWYIIEDGTSLEHYAFPDYVVYRALPKEGLGISGNPQRNLALDLLDQTDGFLYFLDDDNIIFPYFFEGALNRIGESKNGIIASQMYKNSVMRLFPSSLAIVPCHIDTAQFFIPVDIIGDERWQPYNYCADGEFFSSLYKKHADRFIIEPKLFCYYNYLR